MLQTRLIPCLLLQKGGLVKTVKFKNAKYVGDPINAVKIFNEKEVDEIVFLDIDATKKNREVQFDLIQDIASECFIPFAYGGGVKDLETIRKLFFLGAEKVILNSSALNNTKLIKEASASFGNQSIVVCIDVKKSVFGKYKVYNHSTNSMEKRDLFEYIQAVEKLGAGEIIINNVNNDGVMKGYDVDLMKKIVELVSVPVVALGGAGDLNDVTDVIKKSRASAAAAGSIFVFKGPHKAVLINYPTNKIQNIFN